MRVLVAYASKRGGTRGIAKIIAHQLRDRGLEVEVCPAKEVRVVDTYDAFVVGSAIYSGRWQRSAVRLLKRIAARTRQPRVFLFQSGPLGDEHADDAQPLPDRVANLASRLDGGHAETFGGRLKEDSQGMLAQRMVKNGKAGDWREPTAISAWADRVADRLVPEDSPT